MITTTPGRGLARYGFAWAYLAIFVVINIVYVCLPRSSRAALQPWASTSVVNLTHDPIGCLVASAFIPSGSAIAWPVLIAVALLGASKVLGSWRTALVCAAGHILGSLISEGVVAYRISAGLLPEADRRLIDVGPSYVVVSALAVAVLYGPWLVRVLAGLSLVPMITVGGIFSGLSTLEVAAVGHTVAIVVGAGLGGFLAWRLRQARNPPQPR
ncbi:MAG TPA: rhomboid-like protein [Trebonia sp.]|nr:rhomboid-like protein [Trebonia sp.]